MTELIFFDRHTKLTPLISCFNSFVISIWDTFLIIALSSEWRDEEILPAMVILSLSTDMSFTNNLLELLKLTFKMKGVDFYSFK